MATTPQTGTYAGAAARSPVAHVLAGRYAPPAMSEIW